MQSDVKVTAASRHLREMQPHRLTLAENRIARDRDPVECEWSLAGRQCERNGNNNKYTWVSGWFFESEVPRRPVAGQRGVAWLSCGLVGMRARESGMCAEEGLPICLYRLVIAI